MEASHSWWSVNEWANPVRPLSERSHNYSCFHPYAPLLLLCFSLSCCVKIMHTEVILGGGFPINRCTICVDINHMTVTHERSVRSLSFGNCSLASSNAVQGDICYLLTLVNLCLLTSVEVSDTPLKRPSVFRTG